MGSLQNPKYDKNIAVSEKKYMHGVTLSPNMSHEV